MIYTGYYANIKKYEEVGLVPVAVSGKVPPFYDGMTYPDFAPRWPMYRKWKDGIITNAEYAQEYKDYLDTLDKKEIKLDFDSPNQCNNMILLCYEKSGDFCHRHVLADWLEGNFGYKVEEYKYEQD